MSTTNSLSNAVSVTCSICDQSFPNRDARNYHKRMCEAQWIAQFANMEVIIDGRSNGCVHCYCDEQDHMHIIKTVKAMDAHLKGCTTRNWNGPNDHCHPKVQEFYSLPHGSDYDLHADFILSAAYHY